MGGRAAYWYPGCHSRVVELRHGSLGIIQALKSCVLVHWIELSTDSLGDIKC